MRRLRAIVNIQDDAPALVGSKSAAFRQTASRVSCANSSALASLAPERRMNVFTRGAKCSNSVEKAAPIFTLESTEPEAEVAAARARVTEAEARLADAKQQMQRPSEIEVLEASLAQAKAMLVQSNLNLARTQTLFDKKWVSKAQLDEVIAQHDRNEAAVAEAERRITAAKLPNRSDLIDAAAASVETARHSLEQAEKGLAKRQVFAPAAGTVEEVYFRPGEVVNSGQAVVALLPPGNLKVRFFVAEPVRASLHTGQTVKVSCDGCQGRTHRHDQLYRARGRVHPAGDLLARTAAEARVPDRGEALRRSS